MRLDHLLSKEMGEVGVVLLLICQRGKSRNFWWRCAWGTHPFSSRTRWLRPKRPMVLYWRRYGRAGGCQISFKKIAEKRLNKYWFYQWLEIKTKFWFLMTDKNSVRFVPWKPNIEIINQLECKAFKVISKFAKRYNKTSEGSCRDVRSNKQNETKPKVTSR